MHCSSEDEARATAPTPPTSAAPGTWPVFYFESDTSGEKPVEEFFTDDERVDLERFSALGVVRQASSSPEQAQAIGAIRSTRNDLVALFEQDELPKAAIVETLTALVPTFEHVETGRGLDSKM
jgi:hypothetical protein